MSWPRITSTECLTIDTQARGLAFILERDFAGPRGGVVKVMESMYHLWEEVISTDDTPRVLICCTGEQLRGPFEEQDLTCRVDRHWTIVLLRGHGLRNLEPGADGGPATFETLNQSIEFLRDTVRAVNGFSAEHPVNYQGWSAIPATHRAGMTSYTSGRMNIFIAGAVLEFRSANDIPRVLDLAETITPEQEEE